MEKLFKAIIQVWYHDYDFKKMCPNLVDWRPDRVKMLINQKDKLFEGFVDFNNKIDSTVNTQDDPKYECHRPEKNTLAYEQC